MVKFGAGLVFLMLAAFGATRAAAQETTWENLSYSRLGDSGAGDTTSGAVESTAVRIPLSLTLRSLEEAPIGIRLRLPLYFAWNRIPILDVGGEDIVHSLKTLSVTPGLELLIPAGERWLVRPFVEFGAVGALEIDEFAWLGSIGSRASATWDFESWHFTGGVKLQYSAGFTSDWDFHDDTASIDLGAIFTWPLAFEVNNERTQGGLFLIPRWYFDEIFLDGFPGNELQVEGFLEVGISFETPAPPTVLGVKLPRWYGLGYRFARNYGALRIYLGFPF